MERRSASGGAVNERAIDGECAADQRFFVEAGIGTSNNRVKREQQPVNPELANELYRLGAAIEFNRPVGHQLVPAA